jgi:cytochrome c-type biogenesis protein CcmH
MPSPRRYLPCWIVIALWSCSTPPPDPAHELETKLYAPCCWRQTLADHESPLAAELRGEIAKRLAAGEAPAAIEGAFVERYGERIRALGSSGPDPRVMIGGVTAIAVVLGLLLVWGVLRRGRAARRRGEAAPAEPAEIDERLADRLDDELAALPD